MVHDGANKTWAELIWIRNEQQRRPPSHPLTQKRTSAGARHPAVAALSDYIHSLCIMCVFRQHSYDRPDNAPHTSFLPELTNAFFAPLLIDWCNKGGKL